MLYDDFKLIVDKIFNNWTALQLAVQHGMGSPGGKETAQLMSVYVARYCVENLVDEDELQELLDDLMDEEFETSCRDNSPREVACVLLYYLSLLKNGRYLEVQAGLNSMPNSEIWLSQPAQTSIPPQTHGNPDDDTTSSSDDGSDSEMNMNKGDIPCNSQPSTSSASQNQEPMDEDCEPGWTIVRTRRKK